MGSYRSEDEALVGLARQLTDAYGEARTREDQDYACDAIAEYLSELRDTAPDEALLAFLDLPLTAECYPLVDEAQVALAERGPGVVRLLLAAVLGDVYDSDGPAPERAAETIDMMPTSESSAGLCRVLCAADEGRLKGAALDALVALGDAAEPELVAALDDPEGGEWAAAALEQLRYVRPPGDPPAGDDQDRQGESFAPADDGEADAGAAEPSIRSADTVVDEGREIAVPEAGSEPGAGQARTGQDSGGAGDVAAEGPSDGSGAGGPDKDLLDEAFDEFRRRFERESGGGSPTP